MRLFLFCLSIAIGCTILPLVQTSAQVSNVFEGQDASIETSVLLAPITPIESAFVSFGNGIVIQSLLSQPAIFPQENDKVSWGNANATIHSMPRDPFSGPPVNFEELLAAKFKPILYLHQDEKYKPQEIQVVLDTADLYRDNTLIQSTPPALSPTLLASSTASDYKLDLDGDVFIEQSPITNETYKNTAYAHITKDENHIVLQYWFFYYFNDWEGGPDHEGDWEFIQLIFPADKTVQEIIDQDTPPDDAVYSAHLGGYRASWSTVEKDSVRPIVYVAKGSHANYFRKGICDLTTPRGSGVDEVQPQNDPPKVINSQPIIGPVDNTTFNWLLFGGKWGGDTFSSPDSPLSQATILTGERKWDMPIAWAESRISGFPIVTEWNEFYENRCDGDFDGIWNNIDTQDAVFSNDFDAPGPFGRDTEGTITERGDRNIKIKDDATRGAYIEIETGEQIARIELDGIFCFPISTITAHPFMAFRVIATCLSSQLEVEEGSADFTTFHNGIEVVATVNANQTVHYEVVEDRLRIETSGDGEIEILVNGEPTVVQAGETFFVRELEIDIKPGSARNSVNCKNRKTEVIPAAILTTVDFDATTVDHSTVVFEGASEMHAKRHPKDVDGDGDTDLMFHFRLGDTTLTCASTEATLIGRTLSGDIVISTDSIDTKNK